MSWTGCSARKFRSGGFGLYPTKASTTLTMLAILILGIVVFSHGETTVGGIVMFMSFAGCYPAARAGGTNTSTAFSWTPFGCRNFSRCR